MKNLTGAPLTSDAWVDDLKEPVEEKLAGERKLYDGTRGEPLAPSESRAKSESGKLTEWLGLQTLKNRAPGCRHAEQRGREAGEERAVAWFGRGG